MKNLVKMRAQARLCKQLAIREPANRVRSLAEAERWSRLERDEISALFMECNVIRTASEAETAASASVAKVEVGFN
jgi:hypothetical protein